MRSSLSPSVKLLSAALWREETLSCKLLVALRAALVGKIRYLVNTAPALSVICYGGLSGSVSGCLREWKPRCGCSSLCLVDCSMEQSFQAGRQTFAELLFQSVSIILDVTLRVSHKLSRSVWPDWARWLAERIVRHKTACMGRNTIAPLSAGPSGHETYSRNNNREGNEMRK